jgi:hypothetical protein
MLAFAPDRVRKRQFWGVLSPICGRYQLNADFFNTLTPSRSFMNKAKGRGQDEKPSTGGRPAEGDVPTLPRRSQRQVRTR